MAFYRSINVIGPRRVGKTTLVRDLYQGGKYISLEKTDISKVLEMDPVPHLEELKEEAGTEPVIIDDFAQTTKLVLPVKILLDRDKSKGQFIFTGSWNVFTLESVPDSLLGRVVSLYLWPLTVTEIKKRPPSRLLDWMLQEIPELNQIVRWEKISRKEYIRLILQGGYPEARDLPIHERQKLYKGYVNDILDRDFGDVFPIRKRDKFIQLIIEITTYTAKEINRLDLAKSIGVKWETVDVYLDVLKKLMLVIEARAWTSSEAKREIKQSKFHFIDTGMNCALRGFNEGSFKLGNPTANQLGGLLESFVFNELLRMVSFQSKGFRLYHWRSADRRNIDIIVEGQGRLVGIKVKAASTVNRDDFKHLKWFDTKGPGKSLQFKGIVFYLGERKLSFGDGWYALPVSSLWAEINQD